MAPATRPYRDFLMPSLHRRFTRASGYTIVLCYLIALWMAEWSHPFWAWFPIGPTGVRTGLLCIPALSILVLRVANWHAGQRNTESPWTTFYKYAIRSNSFWTLGAYIFSAWFFGEVYIWSRTPKAKLGMTDPGKLHERIKLNERPIYIRFLFVSVAVVQGVIHLWRDYDRISIPTVKTKPNKKEGASIPDKDPRKELLHPQKIVHMATQAYVTAAAAFAIGSFIYFFGLRYVIWEWHYSFQRRFISLAKTSRPTGLPPFFDLVLRYASEGPILIILWEFVNKIFDIYITQAPLKRDKPITSDSKDPNGSLLNGLKAKKPHVKNVAFWELAMITERFNDRRKTIYGELDRKTAPTHKQVTEICLAEIRDIINRIKVVTNLGSAPDTEQKKPAVIELVPQIAPPLKDAQITAPAPPPEGRLQKIEWTTSQIARAHSSPQNAEKSVAREYLKKGQAQLTERTQQAESLWTTYFNKFTCSPFGWPFRASLARTANVVVNGAPYSRQSTILNAITTLTNLAVNSLKEDEYGQYNEQVPEIVRIFTAAIRKIEQFMQGLPIASSDIETLSKPVAERKNVPEVMVVQEALKGGLERVLGAFNEYLGGMGMSRSEIMEAKTCVAREPKEEMRQVS